MNSLLSESEILLKKGEILFKEGEFSDYLYIIESGEICTFLVSDSRVLPLNLYGSESLIGENCSHRKNMTYTENAVAMIDSKLVRINITDIQVFLGESEVWVTSILDELSNKIQQTQTSIKEHRVSNTKVFKNGFSAELEKFLIKSL